MTAAVFAPASTSWALVERAQAGDKDAFADIYRTYQPMIAGWIYKHTGNRQVTEDLTADVFLRALRNIGTVTWQGKDISAWLHTVARNRVADYRKAHAQSHTTVTATVGFDKADDDPAVAPETVAVKQSTSAVLFDAVARLKPEYRQCLILRMYNDLSLVETAQAMGRTVPAIKMLQHRALASMARNEAVRALGGAA